MLIYVSFHFLFFFSSRRRHTRSVSAFLLNRSSDLSQLYVFMPPRFGGMKTYNWEGVNPDGYFLDKLEPIPSALPSFQKLFQVSARSEERRVGKECISS